jgi:hypothetical protein
MAVYTILLFSSLVLFWGDFFVVLGTKAWSSRVLNAQSLSYSPAFLGDLYSTILKLTGHHDDHPVDPTNGLPLPLESGVGNQRTKTKTNDLDLCDAESQKNESSTAEHPAKRWVEEKTIV